MILYSAAVQSLLGSPYIVGSMRTGELVTDEEEVIATKSGYIKGIFTRKIVLLTERAHFVKF